MIDLRNVIVCPSCGAKYRRPASIPPQGVRVTCKSCSTAFIVEGTPPVPVAPIHPTIAITEPSPEQRTPKKTLMVEPESSSLEKVSGYSATADEHRDQVVTAVPAPEYPVKKEDIPLPPQQTLPPKEVKISVQRHAPAEDEELRELFDSVDTEEIKEKKPFPLKTVAVIFLVLVAAALAVWLFFGSHESTVVVRTVSETPTASAQAAASNTEKAQPAATPVKAEPATPPTPAPTPETQKSDLVKEQEEAMHPAEPVAVPVKKTEKRSAVKPTIRPMSVTAIGPAKTDISVSASPKTNGSSKVLVKKGWSSIDKGDNDGAIALFSRAAEMDANEGEAYYGLAEAYKAKGQSAKAKEYYQKALGARLKESDKSDIRILLSNM